jgi:hypothetical protein
MGEVYDLRKSFAFIIYWIDVFDNIDFIVAANIYANEHYHTGSSVQKLKRHGNSRFLFHVYNLFLCARVGVRCSRKNMSPPPPRRDALLEKHIDF